LGSGAAAARSIIKPKHLCHLPPGTVLGRKESAETFRYEAIITWISNVLSHGVELSIIVMVMGSIYPFRRLGTQLMVSVFHFLCGGKKLRQEEDNPVLGHFGDFLNEMPV